jgi:hypothetical protein
MAVQQVLNQARKKRTGASFGVAKGVAGALSGARSGQANDQRNVAVNGYRKQIDNGPMRQPGSRLPDVDKVGEQTLESMMKKFRGRRNNASLTTDLKGGGLSGSPTGNGSSKFDPAPQRKAAVLAQIAKMGPARTNADKGHWNALMAEKKRNNW